MEKLFVIKVGGNVIDEEPLLKVFLHDFVLVKGRKILVHGGGKVATQIGEKLGIQSNYVDGRRITDKDTIDLVTMVYGGLINKKIVAQLQGLDCNAIGLTGADANLIPAKKRPVKNIDYGFAGDIERERLKAENIRLLLDNKIIPVFAPLTHDGHGQMLNTNADTIAAALAVSLSVEYEVRLIYCFEKKGILKNIKKENDIVPLINKIIYKKLIEEKALSDGIIPKLDNALEAITKGVKEVVIGHSDDLLQNITSPVSGTLIQ